LHRGPQCVLLAKKANHRLGWASKHAASRSREVILPLLGSGEANLACSAWFGTAWYKKDTDVLG